MTNPHLHYEDPQMAWFQNENRGFFMDSHPRLARVFSKIGMQPGMLVLNVGVGDGFMEDLVEAVDGIAFSLDPDAQTISRQLKKLKVNSHDAAAKVGILEDIPFVAGMFDAVVASEVLEHLKPDNRRQALAEILRALKPTGVFVGSVPFNEDLAASMHLCPCCGTRFHAMGHTTSFNEETLAAELRAAGFTLVEISAVVIPQFAWAGGWRNVKELGRVLVGVFNKNLVYSTLMFRAHR